jgi:ketosteroid isomerase-like protein
VPDSTDLTLEQRVKRIEDRFAIGDLVAEYCFGIDNRDLGRFVACFTADAVVRHQDGVMELRGRDAIHEYYARRFRDYGVTFHYPHVHTVEIESDTEATGVVSGHAEMGLSGEGWLAALRYTDRYRFEEGRWRFAERVIATWYYMRLADLPDGLGSHLRKHYRGELKEAELPESLDTYRAWLNADQP